MANGSLIRFFRLFVKKRELDLHHDKAHEHQRRANIALDAEPLAEQEKREDRREDRLERENETRAGLIFTLEPVFSAIFAFFLLGERLGVKGYIGAALMLMSLVVMEVELPFFDEKAEKAD